MNTSIRIAFFFSLFLLVAGTCCTGALAESKTRVILYADGSYPPYSYEENGIAKGIYADIIRLAAKHLPGYDIQLTPVPWNRALNLVKNGHGFGLYPPYHRTKERPYIAPYSIPILAEEVVVVCRDDVFIDRHPKQWPEDFFDLRISKNLGFSMFDDTTNQAIEDGKIRIDENPNAAQNLKKMIAGRTDCYVNDKAAIYWELKKLRKNEIYRPGFHGDIVTYAVLSSENGYIGYSAQAKNFPFKDDFVRQMDTALTTLQANGEISRILSLYLGN